MQQFRKRGSGKVGAKLSAEDYAKAGNEHAHQTALFMWASQEIAAGRYSELALMFAIPNGGERNPIVAARLKAEGVKAGVPDIFLPVQRHGVAGLFLELKRPKAAGQRKGSVQAVQTDWIGRLQAQGYGACIVYGFEEAKEIIIKYLS